MLNFSDALRFSIQILSTQMEKNNICCNKSDARIASQEIASLISLTETMESI